ncbi:acetolactate synthase small subunit [Dactylosporangium sp. CA-092794]|uniref:acetolactate synthase small subunit n=1 Tax=Dactylosporangium sp. CA-092794 TaxID=3239929 RepID=UPI003D907467
MQTRTLSILVENRPWSLTRIAALLSRRGFAVDSLAVGPSERPELARVTVVVDSARQPVAQIAAQLDKLVDVREAVPLDPDLAVRRELVLVKVAVAGAAAQARVAEILRLFHASTEQVGADAVVVQAVGTAAELASLLALLDEFGVREVVRSGAVALEGCVAPAGAGAGRPGAGRLQRAGASRAGTGMESARWSS